MAANVNTDGRWLKMSYTTPGQLMLTMMAWVYFPSVPAQTCIFFDQESDSTSWPRVGLSGGLFTWVLNATPGAASASAPNAKQWTHCAFSVYSADISHHSMWGYLNGQAVVTLTDNTTYNATNAQGFGVGNASFAAHGYVRDFRAWNRYMNGTEIGGEFASGRPRSRQGLVANCPLDQNLTKENYTQTGTRLVQTGGAITLVGLGGSTRGKRPLSRGRL